MPAKYNLLPLTTFANQTQLDSITSLLLPMPKLRARNTLQSWHFVPVLILARLK